MRKTAAVQTRFLLGPAGSGKTFRCLAEVRAALAQSPAGPPLVFLAPKQATFQIERQLLESGEIAGFSRLHILSFDRLAQFVFEKLNVAPPKMLSGEGRLMVLRALLQRHADELKLFRGSARRAGFAQELGALLAELQEHQFSPAKLRALSDSEKLSAELRGKLHDLALLSENYAGWLREHELQDANCLLDFATEALRDQFRTSHSALRISGLWLDGFAEMTPQELALLAAVMPHCGKATLAFCLETEPTPTESWLSIWSAIGKTFQRCRDQIAALPGCEVRTEILPRTPGQSRFAPDSELATLEESWTLSARPVGVRASACSTDRLKPELQPTGALPAAPEFEISNLKSQICLTACANPEAEAVHAAREILKFVRAGNRFRDCAVLVRQLDAYHKPLARVFRRYEIPFFLDRRESVAHHPLAELTRNALRVAAHDWRAEDLFAALKAGFASVDEPRIDDLENRALEFGWRGKTWREPLPDENAERVRREVTPPFEQMFSELQRLQFKPDGSQLAGAIRNLWEGLQVEKTLEAWTSAGTQSAIHQTVWEQMNAWLDNIALAFPRESLPLADWLPILDAGLGGLTVGVIPPSLDEVLVGAIDRARNPSLKFALVLGANESIFPAAPAVPVILTASDREELDRQNITLGPDVLSQISRERYLGYIACTRANEKLALAFSRQGNEGKALNPSPFIAQLQKMFPALAVEEFSAVPGWREAEHANELTDKLVGLTTPHPSPLPSEGRGGNAPSLAHEQNPVLEDVALKNLPADAGCSLSHPVGEGQGEGNPSIPKLLLTIPALKTLAEKVAALREPDAAESLSRKFAARIYGPVLKTSVSRLEEFASCPFKFFMRVGLRANERKVFELDARERGNFQHDVLKSFHEQITQEGKRWRDLAPAEARERIKAIADQQMASHRDGLFLDSAETAFAARAMTAALQDFVEVIVGWMRSQYEFDPALAEFGFGGKDDSLPAWELELSGGRKLALQGRIDRVDIWRDPANDALLAVVTDYKSGGKKLEPVFVENGIQLQLLAYLGALKTWSAGILPAGFAQDVNSPAGSRRSNGKLVPVGAFYVSLRGKFAGGGSREEILADTESSKFAYRHNGRFNAGWLKRFDRRTDVTSGDQFNYRLKNDGSLYKNSAEALPKEEFENLLNLVESQMRKLGDEIFSGRTAVDPYRKGKDTPCEFCDYRAACRLDEWTHEFRELRLTEKSADEPK